MTSSATDKIALAIGAYGSLREVTCLLLHVPSVEIYSLLFLLEKNKIHQL